MTMWTFQHGTTIVFGAGVWKELPERSKGLGQRLLLVTGESSLARLGLLAPLLDGRMLGAAPVHHLVIPGEPDADGVDGGVSIARSLACDGMLAVGGGSVIDAAKAISILVRSRDRARDHLEDVPGHVWRPVSGTGLPLIAVPTTAGTGAEVTRNAVLQVPEHGIKRSLRSSEMLPRIALIDPELSGAAPLAIASAAAFDALAHLAESLVSTALTPMAALLAQAGIPKAVSGLRALAAGRPDPQSRADLALAATWGGMALGNAGLGAAHGLVAPLGGRLPVPHGAGLACLLPQTMLVNSRALDRHPGLQDAQHRYRELAGLITGRPGDQVCDAVAELVALRRACGLPGLAAYGLGRQHIPGIIGSPSGSLRTNPIPLAPEELSAILEGALAD